MTLTLDGTIHFDLITDQTDPDTWRRRIQQWVTRGDLAEVETIEGPVLVNWRNVRTVQVR